MASRRDMHEDDGEHPSERSGERHRESHAGPSGPAKGPRRRDPNAGLPRDGKFAGKPAGKSAAARPTRLRGPLGDEMQRTDRPLQVAGEIRRAVQAEIARGLNDPRVQGLVSVTDVELTPDLAQARIKVSVLPEQKASLTLSGLRAAAGFLRRRVMDETRIGRVPTLVFEVDERFKREAALDSAIRSTSGAASAESTASAIPVDEDEGDGKERPEDKTR